MSLGARRRIDEGLRYLDAQRCQFLSDRLTNKKGTILMSACSINFSQHVFVHLQPDESLTRLSLTRHI